MSAVEAVSAIEELKKPDDVADANVPAATTELADADTDAQAADAEAVNPAGSEADSGPEDAGEPAEAGASQSGAVDTATDHEVAGPPSAERTAPVARTVTPKPQPSPSFTAARPGERSATPTFSAARPATRTGGPAAPPSGYGPAQPKSGAAQYGAAESGAAKSGAAKSGAAQYGPAQYEAPQPGSAQYGANLYGGTSYAGPAAQQPSATAPYRDQSVQYTPGSGGGRAQRRPRPRWQIVLVVCAVLVAVAIGAGTAIVLGHHDAKATAGTPTDPAAPAKTPPMSVNALNHPSSVVPAGWQTDTLQPSAAKTNGGFTISTPPGWTKQSKGLGTYFRGPNDLLLEVDLTPHKYPNDMVREAERIEQGAEAKGSGFPDYRRLNLEPVTVRGTKGAFWKFTWSRNGQGATTDDILFVLPAGGGSQSYAVYLRGLSKDFNSEDLPLFDKILHTFQTIPPSR